MKQHEIYSEVFKANVIKENGSYGFYDVYSGNFVKINREDMENINHNLVHESFKKLYNVEHIIPGSIYGKREDIFYDLHNSVPSIKILNDYRSNLPITEIPKNTHTTYSMCDVDGKFDIKEKLKTDICPSASIGTKEGVLTLRNKLYINDPKTYQVSGCINKCYFQPAATPYRGLIARSVLYFNSKYRKFVKSEDFLKKYLSLSILQTMKRWDNQYPPTPYEIERNFKIFKLTGITNSFFRESMKRVNVRNAMKNLLQYSPDRVFFEVTKKGSL